jgi:hypothetical protein
LRRLPQLDGRPESGLPQDWQGRSDFDANYRFIFMHTYLERPFQPGRPRFRSRRPRQGEYAGDDVGLRSSELRYHSGRTQRTKTGNESTALETCWWFGFRLEGTWIGPNLALESSLSEDETLRST